MREPTRIHENLGKDSRVGDSKYLTAFIQEESLHYERLCLLTNEQNSIQKSFRFSSNCNLVKKNSLFRLYIL